MIDRSTRRASATRKCPCYLRRVEAFVFKQPHTAPREIISLNCMKSYASSDRNWATIDAVVRIAKEIGVAPTQVALSWIADRPGVIAPIVGARTVEHLRNNLGAAELVLENEETAALEKVSAPQSGGYPYGVFGAGQRGRWLQDETPAPTQPYSAGSEHPTGRA
jgi:hypothetical protein